MTLATLTWSKRTESSFAIAGAVPTIQEILNKLETFINGCTHWQVSQKVLDTSTVLRGYLEIKPRVDPDGARLVIAYCGKTTAPTQPAAANKQLPYDADSTSRLWVGMSPNAGTTGPNASPYTSLAYTTAGWSKMFPFSSTNPANGSAIGAIESAEGLLLYWFTSANQMDYVLFGKLAEAPDGNSAEWLLGMSCGAAWNSLMGSAGTQHPISDPSQNHSVGSSAQSKLIICQHDGTMRSFGRAFPDSIYTLGQGFAGTDYAVLDSILGCGAGYFSGASQNFYGFFRQMRWGPASYNLQRLLDGSGGTQAISVSWNTSVAQVGNLWFDNQR